MATSDVIATIRERIQCRFPLLFLSTWEEERWENEIATLALDLEHGLVDWSFTDGASPPLDAENPDDAESHRDPATFLRQIRNYPRGHLFLLRDFHPFLTDPIIVRLLRDQIPMLVEQQKTILLMSPEIAIPLELRRDAVGIDLPLPGLAELKEELRELLIQRQHNGEPHLHLSSRQEERLLKTVLGLTARQARQSMARALFGRSELTDKVFSLLISEKAQMVQGSDLLEFQPLSDSVKDIGGLDALKEWVKKRADAFSERARQQGIPAPKGVLLLGVQGCGKSLTARAIAHMMSFPLVRLDVSTLLSAGLGQSEKNLRDVLALCEMVAPTVLWLDEIEKGFAGVGDGAGSDSTMVRLMGRFLTWMQEKQAPVFVVATANSVSTLPPEMLRRGRFDELFFVDLPNYHERKQIISIHLQKKKLPEKQFDLSALAQMSEGYSGAELEQAVLTAVVESFNRGQPISQKELADAIGDTVPLSVTMEEKIFELREWARTRCRAATPDSRVLQMLEEEQREKTGDDNKTPLFDLLDENDLSEEEDNQLDWRKLIADGQVRAGLLEYISGHESVSFQTLQRDLAEHIETNGEFGLALRSDSHVVLWLSMSADIAAPLSRLISDCKVYLHPLGTSDDGSVLPVRLPRLPLLSDSRVSRPCWLPVRLSVVQPAELDERLTRVARMKLNQ